MAMNPKESWKYAYRWARSKDNREEDLYGKPEVFFYLPYALNICWSGSHRIGYKRFECSDRYITDKGYWSAMQWEKNDRIRRINKMDV